jgi:hypothetical protein
MLKFYAIKYETRSKKIKKRRKQHGKKGIFVLNNF